MHMKLIYSFILLAMLLSFSPTFAQSEILRGTIYDGSKTVTMVGATVMLLNENNRIVMGCISGATGEFKMEVPNGVKKVVFSFIGYKSISRDYVKGKVYEIILQEDSKMLDVAEVIAKRNDADLGLMQQSRRELVSAVSSVDMEALENSSVSSVEQLLQGAAPGLLVSFNSGDPGAGASVQIRGATSLEEDSSPLWIIDGVEVISDDYEVESLTNFGFSAIGDLEPSDIASIDVLKDASSTAIYGSRGANGVIVIRTKRGVKGKPQFSASAKFDVTFVPNKVPMLSGEQHKIFMIEQTTNKNGGYDTPGSHAALRGDLSREDAWLYNNNTDWIDLIQRNGFQQNYTFSLRGGGERLSYYWGLSYVNEYGTTVGGGYDRISTNVNLDYKISNKLKISTKFSYSNSLTDKRSSAHPMSHDSRSIAPMTLARVRQAYFPTYNENGTEYYIGLNDGPSRETTSWTSQFHPLAIIDYSTFKNKANRFMSSIVVNYSFLKNLSLYSQVSVDYRQSGDEYFMPPYAIGAMSGENSYNYGRSTDGYQMKIVNNNRVIYTPFSNDFHKFVVTGVFNLAYNTANSMAINYSNGASPELRSADASAKIESMSGGNSESSTMGIVVNASYKVLNRYFLNFALKTEASSLYGSENPFSIFPSLGLSYDMKREHFFEDKEWVGLIKPRIAYGRSGKLPKVANILNVVYATAGGGYLENDYTYISKFAYDNVHEERTTDWNYGIDWNLFDGRFNGEFNYYTRKTKDLLLKEQTSSVTGFTSQYTNFGTIKNAGWEVGLIGVWMNNTEKRFRWKTSFNIARNRNTLVELPDNYDSEAYTKTMSGFKSKLVEGDVIGGFYGYKALGVYANDSDAAVRDFKGNIVYNTDGTTRMLRQNSATGHQFQGGDMIYEDVNKDGLISELDMVQIGDANPDVFGSLRNEFTYKDWSLTIGLYYSLGQDVVNGMRQSAEGMTDSRNQARSIERRWRAQGDITDMPRAEASASWNTLASTRWVEDASYVKLKDLSLTYRWASRIVKKIGFRSMSTWVNATNLITWSKYKGIDPEVGRSGGISIFGVDNQLTAPPIRCTFGIRASF